MTQTSNGMSSIYDALRFIDPTATGRHRVVSAIEEDVRSHIQANRPQMREALDQLEAMANQCGETFAMMAVRLFLEIHKYHLRRDPLIAEFDEAFTQVARDLARTFVLVVGS